MIDPNDTKLTVLKVLAVATQLDWEAAEQQAEAQGRGNARTPHPLRHAAVLRPRLT